MLRKVDPRGVATCFASGTCSAGGALGGSSYDALNRAGRKAYSAGSSEVNLCYDGKHWNSSTSVCETPATAVANPIGRLTSTSSLRSQRDVIDFDAQGRILEDRQTTIVDDSPWTAKAYGIQYTYNPDGSLKTQTNPSGRLLSFSYDKAARVSSADGTYQTAPTNYATGFTYAPHGALSQLTLGNGLLESTNFNNRLQPTQIQAGSLLTLDFQYNPAGQSQKNNGNIHEQKITATGLPGGFLTQTYTYDALNRLGSITEGSWSRNFGFDRYGNRWISGTTGHALHSSTPTASTDFAAATNRLLKNAATFDNAGNLLSETFLGDMAYDADNHQTTFTDPVTSAVTTYTYDGAANRVRKITPAATTVYVYNAFGKLAAEYASAAPSGPTGTQYRTTDHLGSTRLVTNATQGVISRRDFFPFGEVERDQVAGYNQPSGYRQQFTGQERDGESEFDYFLARYYSGPLGRFTSVDSFNVVDIAGGDRQEFDTYISDAQHWNRYAYVLNNPLRYIDPLGLLEYETKLLGRAINVHVDDNLSQQRQSQLKGRLDASITNINNNQGKLSNQENKVLGNLNSIDVDASAKRAYVIEETGGFTLTPDFVDQSSDEYLGSAIGHDAFHVELFKEGGTAKSRGVDAEKKSFQFQLDFGLKIGLAPYEADYLQELLKDPEKLKEYYESPIE